MAAHCSQNRKPCPFAVLGLGKFGGRELGYASDIEILFVYGGSGTTNGKNEIENSEYFERLAQELLGMDRSQTRRHLSHRCAASTARRQGRAGQCIRGGRAATVVRPDLPRRSSGKP